jgi:hypothetical protein
MSFDLTKKKCIVKLEKGNCFQYNPSFAEISKDNLKETEDSPEIFECEF